MNASDELLKPAWFIREIIKRPFQNIMVKINNMAPFRFIHFLYYYLSLQFYRILLEIFFEPKTIYLRKKLNSKNYSYGLSDIDIDIINKNTTLKNRINTFKRFISFQKKFEFFFPIIQHATLYWESDYLKYGFSPRNKDCIIKDAIGLKIQKSKNLIFDKFLMTPHIDLFYKTIYIEKRSPVLIKTIYNAFNRVNQYSKKRNFNRLLSTLRKKRYVVENPKSFLLENSLILWKEWPKEKISKTNKLRIHLTKSNLPEMKITEAIKKIFLPILEIRGIKIRFAKKPFFDDYLIYIFVRDSISVLDYSTIIGCSQKVHDKFKIVPVIILEKNILSYFLNNAMVSIIDYLQLIKNSRIIYGKKDLPLPLNKEILKHIREKKRFLQLHKIKLFYYDFFSLYTLFAFRLLVENKIAVFDTSSLIKYYELAYNSEKSIINFREIMKKSLRNQIDYDSDENAAFINLIFTILDKPK